MEDRDILECFFERKETAITEVTNTYGSYCAAVAGRILSAEEDIQEVLNDTWLRAWNAIPPEKPDNLKLYLARITRNLSFDRFRRQSRQIRGSGELTLALEELNECIAGGVSPEALLEEKELRQAVNQFLGTLKKRDRQIFLLRYYYVETTEDIARRYAIRPALVRTVLSRTRNKLHAYLTKEGFLHG